MATELLKISLIYAKRLRSSHVPTILTSPDHYTCSTLGYEACFLAGLTKLDIDEPLKGHGFSRAERTPGKKAASAAEGPHRPFKIVYATLYFDVRPTFVVDITDQFESRMQSIFAYKSQYLDQEAGKGDFPPQQEIRSRVESMARFYGLMAGVKYAEPFLQKEVGLVDNLALIPVKSV